MASSAGQKVTNDPAADNAIPEAVGVVTSDSLAAESLQSGSFGAGNPKAAASKQPSASTTTNTTDTSSATKLDPAVNKDARDAAKESSNAAGVLDDAKGAGKDAGVGPTYNTTSGSGSAGNAAPTAGYAGGSECARQPGELRPHGANITETEDLEGKTEFGEVGTDKDPGRAAELQREKRAALSGAAAGAKDTSAQDGGSKFSTLGEEAA